MKFLINNTPELSGAVTIPGNKSGTARGLLLGAIADGETVINNPLNNIDSFSIIDMLRMLGAEIDTSDPTRWTVKGTGGRFLEPKNVLNAGNSGTGYYMVAALATLIRGTSVISGDYQICYRPAGPLVEALNALGAHCFSTRNNGLAPLVIKGLLQGGKATLPNNNSQWLTPLLVAGSLAERDSEITITGGVMMEKPYINMTIGMFKQAGVTINHDDYQKYYVKGGMKFKPCTFNIPGDWGSSGYPLTAAAITDSEITLTGLNLNDYAGERAYVDIYRKAGKTVEEVPGGIRIKKGGKLVGQEIDCAGTPDAVPALAVMGCAAEGKTVLYNIGASRMKETDRTAIIKQELTKMGGRFEETKDTLTIYHSSLHGAFIDGHHDHRIVMATSVAALIADGPTIVDNAEYVGVSYPNFYQTMKNLKANIERLEIIN
jgi:3-phosphoshikimate 1-carboxyvinyltransferase